MNVVSVCGVNINNLRYPNDTALLTCNGKGRQDLVTAVNDTGRPHGMEMNVMKAKTIVFSISYQKPEIKSQLKESPLSNLKRCYILVI